jgi:hypothetical protein
MVTWRKDRKWRQRGCQAEKMRGDVHAPVLPDIKDGDGELRAQLI